ncbi:MAG: hypothetical protein ACTHLU_08375 [Novosphingobium sp.]
MKKIALLALAASTAAIATPSMAQTVTGTINMTGTVAPKCTVSGQDPTAFSDTVQFNELAATNGTLRSGLATDFGTRSASVVCTTATPKITVWAKPLAATATAPSGYANSIDYTASVAVSTTGANAGPFTDVSTGGATGPTTIGGGRLSNAANNINITTANYNTNGNNTDILVADSYVGSVVVTITPN